MDPSLLITFASFAITAGVGCCSLLFSLLLVVGSFMLVARLIGAANNRGESMPNGVTAPALVLTAQATGTSINESPQVRLQVRVVPPEGAEFEAQVLTFISQVQGSLVQPGNIVQVRYNAQKPAQIVMSRALGTVEGYAPAGGAMPPLPPLLHRLIESQERSEALASAPELSATVVSCEELGLYCGGKNPLLTLVAEVRPLTGPPYNVELTGVVSQLSRHKFVPGGALFVRVAPNDPTRATISRSV